MNNALYYEITKTAILLIAAAYLFIGANGKLPKPVQGIFDKVSVIPPKGWIIAGVLIVLNEAINIYELLNAYLATR